MAKTGFTFSVLCSCFLSEMKQPPVVKLEAVVLVLQVLARKLRIRLHTQLRLIKTRYLIGF